MQVVARVAQHLVDAPAIKGLQVVAKFAAHLFGAGPLVSDGQLVVLGDVVALQALKSRHWVGQRGGGHAPSANGRADQVHRLGAVREPVAKNEAVQRAEDETLGPTGRARNSTDVFGPQAVGADVRQRGRAGVQSERALGHRSALQRFKPCSLAKAEAMAPAPALLSWRAPL